MAKRTIDELIEFIEIHFDKLTKEKYCELIRMTLQVYVFRKPQKKEKVLEQILTHSFFLLKKLKLSVTITATNTIMANLTPPSIASLSSTVLGSSK